MSGLNSQCILIRSMWWVLQPRLCDTGSYKSALNGCESPPKGLKSQQQLPMIFPMHGQNQIKIWSNIHWQKCGFMCVLRSKSFVKQTLLSKISCHENKHEEKNDHICFASDNLNPVCVCVGGWVYGSWNNTPAENKGLQHDGLDRLVWQDWDRQGGYVSVKLGKGACVAEMSRLCHWLFIASITEWHESLTSPTVIIDPHRAPVPCIYILHTNKHNLSPSSSVAVHLSLFVSAFLLSLPHSYAEI